MKLLGQNRRNNCSQTCLAMISGRSISEVERLAGSRCAMNNGEKIQALSRLGIVNSGVFADYQGNLPPFALVRIARRKNSGGHRSEKTVKVGHLIVWYQNQFYDPANGGQIYGMDRFQNSILKITHFLQIYG